MSRDNELKQSGTENNELIDNKPSTVSLIFRNVPKEKRKELEKKAREFAKKHRKLVNYIEK